MKILDIYNQIEKEKIIAIVRRDTLDEVESCVKGLCDGGINIVELPFTMDKAHRRLEYITEKYPNMLVGAGTILDGASARIAILSGAKFIVTPNVNKEVIEMGCRYGVPVFSGVHSPTEAIKALESGCLAVKLFFASEFDYNTIKAWKVPIKNLEFIPTGGIDETNIKDWLNAGAYALGISGCLCRGDYEQVKKNAIKIKSIIDNYK